MTGDQMAIEIARNPQTEKEWIRRADAFHEKHKNGNAEKRVRAYEAANQKQRMWYGGVFLLLVVSVCMLMRKKMKNAVKL